MRVLLIALFMLFSSFIEEREVVVTQKVITVSGQTSIGGFNCNYSQAGMKDTLYIDRTKSEKDLVFNIPVHNFSCGNFLINKDFRKTIKAETYPTAKVKVNNLKSNYGHYTCDLTVDLVGKQLDFPGLILQRTPEGVVARLVLSFEELSLEAPSKMGGLIKVEEELHLQFTLGF